MTPAGQAVSLAPLVGLGFGGVFPFSHGWAAAFTKGADVGADLRARSSQHPRG